MVKDIRIGYYGLMDMTGRRCCCTVREQEQLRNMDINSLNYRPKGVQVEGPEATCAK